MTYYKYEYSFEESREYDVVDKKNKFSVDFESVKNSYRHQFIVRIPYFIQFSLDFSVYDMHDK